MDNQADITAGNQIHSPMHNRFDSIRDSDVYNSVGSSQGWKSILQSGKVARIKNQWPGSRACGMTSEELSRCVDPSAKQNGGQIKACISYDYERDYILEAMLQDKIRQDSKAAQRKFDLRKTTKTSEARQKLGREKMKLMKEKE